MNSQEIKSLIVGIDFSLYSKLVVKESQVLAEKLKVPVIYVHVLPDARVYRDFYGVTRRGVDEKFIKKAKSFYGLKNGSDIQIEVGDPAEKMIEVADGAFKPLIVVGAIGGHAASKFLIGSTAETLAFTSKYPVWIHRGKSIKLPKKFLMPIDLSSGSEKALFKIELLRKELKAELQLHHVFEEPMSIFDYPDWQNLNIKINEDDKKEFAKYAKKFPQLKMTRSTGSIATEIQKKSKDFDLLALRPKRSGHKRRVFRGVMTKLIRSVEKPILVLP